MNSPSVIVLVSDSGGANQATKRQNRLLLASPTVSIRNVNADQCVVGVPLAAPEIFRKGLSKPFENTTFVMFNDWGRNPDLHCAIAIAVETMGIQTSLPALARLSLDKPSTLMRIHRAGIPVTPYLYGRALLLPELVSEFGVTPARWILKPPNGSMGRGIDVLIPDDLPLRCRARSDERLMLEPFREGEVDWRVLVMDGLAVGAIERRRIRGDINNTSLGALGDWIGAERLEPVLGEIAERACEATGVRFAGVDVLLGPDGYEICEVNFQSPLFSSGLFHEAKAELLHLTLGRLARNRGHG